MIPEFDSDLSREVQHLECVADGAMYECDGEGHPEWLHATYMPDIRTALTSGAPVYDCDGDQIIATRGERVQYRTALGEVEDEYTPDFFESLFIRKEEVLTEAEIAAAIASIQASLHNVEGEA